jgi:L-fuconolactonase
VLSGSSPKGQHFYLDERFRRGFALLAPLGLSFDALVFAPQLADVNDLAQSFPDSRIILDHLGQPVGIGVHAGEAGGAIPRLAPTHV